MTVFNIIILVFKMKAPNEKDQQSIRQQSDVSMKILLIGNSGVGKSCILMQFSEKKFVPNFYNTIGVDFKIKKLVLDKKRIKMQIWDTAGQDRFRTITSSYYRGAHGIVIVYDITDRSSYQGVQNWLNQINKYADESIRKILVGNKCDLDKRRQIPYQQGKKYAQSLSIPFFQTSARDSTNIDSLFESIAHDILGSKEKGGKSLSSTSPEDEGVRRLIRQKQQKQNSSNCC